MSEELMKVPPLGCLYCEAKLATIEKLEEEAIGRIAFGVILEERSIKQAATIEKLEAENKLLKEGNAWMAEGITVDKDQNVTVHKSDLKITGDTDEANP